MRVTLECPAHDDGGPTIQVAFGFSPLQRSLITGFDVMDSAALYARILEIFPPSLEVPFLLPQGIAVCNPFTPREGAMTERLFSGSWHASWSNMVRKAVGDVDGLDRKLFSDPALAGALQKIVEKYSVEVARLNTDPTAITSEAVEEERWVDDYGDRRRVTVKRLKVTIPFTGEAQSLKIAPSRSTIPSHKADVGEGSLTITIADDDNADRDVTQFCQQVQSNLDTLRQEYERDKPQLEQAVSQAAERRKVLVAEENDRDSKRSFTVRR